MIDIFMRVSALLFRFERTTGSDLRRGEGPALQQDDLTTYRRLARREDPFGILRARSIRTKASQL